VRELVVFVYPDVFRAAEVMATLQRMRPADGPNLNDAVCVTCDRQGKVELQYARSPARGVADVRYWRALIGWLVSTAPAPAPVGGPDFLPDDDFPAALRQRLAPDTSAVFVLVRDVTRDRLVPELGAFGGTVLRTPLPADGLWPDGPWPVEAPGR
jgi:uncharacterized membrane protein